MNNEVYITHKVNVNIQLSNITFPQRRSKRPNSNESTIRTTTRPPVGLAGMGISIATPTLAALLFVYSIAASPIKRAENLKEAKA